MKSIKRFFQWMLKVIQYAWFLRNDVDYDYSGLLRLMQYKISRMHKCIKKNNIIINADIICSEMARAEELIKAILEDDYYSEESEDFHKRCGPVWSNNQTEQEKKSRQKEFAVLSKKIIAAQKKDRKELFKILHDKIWGWWD